MRAQEYTTSQVLNVNESPSSLGLEVRAKGKVECRGLGLRFRVQGLGFEVYGLEFKV